MTNDTAWLLEESAFDAEHALAWEGLLTQGSGTLHIRGSLDEHLTGAPQNQDVLRMPGNVTAERFAATPAKWGTYLPGIFGPHPMLDREMINLPWFLELAPTVEGERLDVLRCDVRDWQRTLDLRDGVLTRTLTWHTQAGPVLQLTFERFVSAVTPRLVVQSLTVTTDRPVDVTLHAGIDADVRTSGYDHLTGVTFETDAGLRCIVRTDGGDEIRIASGLRDSANSTWTSHVKERRVEHTTRLRVSPDAPATVHKRTYVSDSRTADALPEPTFDQNDDALRAEHAAHWHARWEACDVVVEGDARSQRALRVALYHLLRCHVPDNPAVAIDAKGYAGDAYFGRFFWDTEMYMLPFYLYTDPRRARSLTDFRIQSLPGARANAAAYGYPGARFAWESDDTGRECCAAWPYRDHELHVTADVVYGVAHYARAAADPGYLSGPAKELLAEVARFWVARTDTRAGDDHPSLLGVMGPDEYTPLGSNNAYTNAMVSFALRLAAEHGACGADEARTFRAVADGLPVPRDENGVVLQCEEFPRLADPRFDALWPGREGGYANHVPMERIYRTKAMKQADVLMLMMLFPDAFTDDEVAAAWDTYLPWTTHDSSLSPGAHAIVACRLGRMDDAAAFWRACSDVDLDIEGGGAAQGIHIANAAAAWMVAVFGFAGLTSALWSDALRLRPRLPDGWTRLAFPLAWRGSRVHVDMQPGTTMVRHLDGPPLEVQCDGARRSLDQGGEILFGEKGGT